MSTGLRMKNGVLNSTIPRAFRGARSRSTRPAFNGSRGSTSRNAVPNSRSQGPTDPHELPPANDCRDSTWNVTTRAWAALPTMVPTATTQTNRPALTTGFDGMGPPFVRAGYQLSDPRIHWPKERRDLRRGSEAGHQLGDDLLHDLAGAAPDGEQPRVAERAGHRRLHHVPHAAVHLLAVVDDLLHQVAGEQLGHADLLHRCLLAVVEVAGAVGEPAGRLDGGEVLDEAVPPDLELGQRLPERAALVAVAQRLLHQVLHPGDGTDGGHQALALEVGHHVVEALVLLAQDVARGDAAILEEEQSGVGGEVADL